MDNATHAPALHPTLPVYHGDSTAYKVVSATLLVTVCGLGIFGNVMVLVVVAVTAHLKTSIDFLLMGLAVADMMVLTAAGIPAITGCIFGHWLYGHCGCPVLNFFQYLGIDASSAFLAAIAIERYITICHPLKAQTLCTVPRAKKCIAIFWTVIGLYCSMWFYLAQMKEVVYANGSHFVCGYRVKRSLYMPIYFIDFGVFYVVPLLLTSVLYSLIAKTLRRTPVETSDQDKEDENEEFVKLDAENCREVTKMMTVVVSLFALLWMPYRILVVVNSLLSKPYGDRVLLLFCRLCIYLNSAINPFVYTAWSPKFSGATSKVRDGGGEGMQAMHAVAADRELSVSLLESPDRATAEMDEISLANDAL